MSVPESAGIAACLLSGNAKQAVMPVPGTLVQVNPGTAFIKTPPICCFFRLSDEDPDELIAAKLRRVASLRQLIPQKEPIAAIR